MCWSVRVTLNSAKLAPKWISGRINIKPTFEDINGSVNLCLIVMNRALVICYSDSAWGVMIIAAIFSSYLTAVFRKTGKKNESVLWMPAWFARGFIVI